MEEPSCYPAGEMDDAGRVQQLGVPLNTRHPPQESETPHSEVHSSKTGSRGRDVMPGVASRGASERASSEKIVACQSVQFSFFSYVHV